MKRTRALPTVAVAAALAAGALGAATVAGAQGAGAPAHAARAAKVKLVSTGLGRILANSSGFTLYSFSKDGRNKDSCAKVSGCAAVWPELTTSGRPTAGPGVKASLLSTIRLAGGVKQVTYAGHPLYIYSADGGPGQTDYVGRMQFGGTWRALNAAGRAVG